MSYVVCRMSYLYCMVCVFVDMYFGVNLNSTLKLWKYCLMQLLLLLIFAFSGPFLYRLISVSFPYIFLIIINKKEQEWRKKKTKTDKNKAKNRNTLKATENRKISYQSLLTKGLIGR